MTQPSVFAGERDTPHGSFWPITALAVGAFAIGTTEFVPMGLLPTIAAGVGVSIPKAGLLVSVYAIGVLVAAPIMTIALARFSRKTALLLLLTILVCGNFLSAAAPNFSMLALARILTSAAHGAFFGIGMLVAASLVPEERRASAISTMIAGLTIANIGGVPAATWLGHAIGWRAAFSATAGLGILGMLAATVALPKVASGERPDVRREIRVLGTKSVLVALATTLFGSGAMFTFYTYIASILEQTIDASHTVIAGMLALVGIGFTVGNFIGGKLADRSPDKAVIGLLASVALEMLVMPFFMYLIFSTSAVLLVWSATVFALVPCVQLRVLAAAREAPGLASSINIGAFNLGNAFGALVGAAVISVGVSFRFLPIAGSILAASGLLMVLLFRTRAR